MNWLIGMGWVYAWAVLVCAIASGQQVGGRFSGGCVERISMRSQSFFPLLRSFWRCG